jgi:ATP/maltotriose-dependent transcriptional regulator MalT
MVELEEQQASAANRHIIERPRLTRLLDETTARVIMLVAPAGYGKTTLARQWLAKRTHVWCAARPGWADPAALGTEIIEAAKDRVDVDSQLKKWLSAQPSAGDSARVADLLVDDLSAWPEEIWFAIDDYQLLTPDAEHVIDRIRAIPPLRLILTSRRRPVWCRSREILYGEIFEVEASMLKMNDAEAAQVLRSVDEATAHDFIELAAGWPAIIGLASFAGRGVVRDRSELPPELHDFVAQELFASVTASARDGLAQLSLLPSVSIDRAKQLLGQDGESVVHEGTRVGFLTGERSGVLAIHPLLREFLRRKIVELPEARRRQLVAAVARLLMEERQWDESFEVARQFDIPQVLGDLLQASLYELLDRGHLKTVSMFIEAGRLRGVDEAILNLADAELAFREGFHERSWRLARRAAEDLAGRSPLASKAFALAGNSAYFGDSIPNAQRAFLRASELARTRDDERRAVWGLFLSALEQEDDAAAEFLNEFERTSGSSPDELVRIQNGRLHFGMRLGTLNYGLSGAEAVAGIVSEAKDPVVRASFWHVYGAACRAAADYSEALEATNNALREITTYDLSFGRAHVYLIRAGALMGTGAHDEALALLDEVARIATRNGDMYLQMNERTNRCKLYLLMGDTADAAHIADTEWPHVGSSGQFAEFLATRAVALAAGGATDSAIAALDRAEALSHENEASTLCTSVRALFGLEQQDTLMTMLPRIREAVSRGILDPFVFVFRLDRRLPRQVAQVPELRSVLQEALNVIDAQPNTSLNARVAELEQALENAGLTKRERDVLGLVSAGRTNREIAQSLFLSESTVKVHVRNVLRKIGARTRTEAAIYALTTRLPEARGEPPASDPDPE